jgi:hypothetical protein
MKIGELSLYKASKSGLNHINPLGFNQAEMKSKEKEL